MRRRGTSWTVETAATLRVGCKLSMAMQPKRKLFFFKKHEPRRAEGEAGRSGTERKPHGLKRLQQVSCELSMAMPPKKKAKIEA